MVFKRRIRFSHKDRQDSPNKETIAAMLEAERIAHDPGVEHYSDVEEALRELKRRRIDCMDSSKKRRKICILFPDDI